MEITSEEAKLIARAFILVNQKLSTELDRIMQSDESEYLKEAAIKKYNEDSEGFTNLHIKMAQAFPELAQR